MPIRTLASTTGIVRPEELALLQRVFDKACQRLKHSPNDEEADAIAVDIIGTFMSGVTDEETLLQAVTDTAIRRTA
jgi:hypothetical protein